MLFLTKSDIKRIFTMADAIEADRQAFLLSSAGECDIPLRTNINVPRHEAQTFFMPGYVAGLNTVGIKIVSVFPQNIDQGKSVISGTVILVDGTTGEVNCVLDGTYVTQIRTGAAAGVATDLLANPNAQVGALIGAGGQAAAQLEAMLTVRRLREVRVYDISRERAREFVAAMRSELASCQVDLRDVDSADEAVEGADIITAVTTAKRSVFDGRRVKKGTHINGVGSFTPEMQELDEYIIRQADKIFADSKETVLAEAGD